MHRKEQFEKLIREWMNLDLDKTCTALDTFTSMEIRKNFQPGGGGTIVFTKKYKGNETEVGRAYIDVDGNINGIVLSTTTPVFGLMLYALEKAIETN